MNNVLYYILAVGAGLLIPVQAATNALLMKATGNIFYSILIVFFIGLLALISLILVVKPEAPAMRDLLNAPIHSFFGGVIVVFYMLTITFISPKIGMGNSILLIIIGQIVSASIIDHYGSFGFLVSAMSKNKLLGLLCIVVGLAIVTRSGSNAVV